MAALYGASRTAPFPQDFDEDGVVPTPLPAIREHEPERPTPAYEPDFIGTLNEPQAPTRTYFGDELQTEDVGVPSFMARPELKAPSLIRPYDDRAPTAKEPPSLLTGEVRQADKIRPGSDLVESEDRPQRLYTPPKTAAPISSVSRNNSIVPGEKFDPAKWQPVDLPKDDYRIDTGDKIAVQVKSEALLPTNQFRFLVTAIPLDEKGNPQPSLATSRWFDPVNYATATGTFFDRTLILGATSAASRHRWIISIPPQQAAHDNAAHNSLQVFVPR